MDEKSRFGELSTEEIQHIMDNAASVTTKTAQGSEQRRLDTARKVSRGNVSFWAALSSVAMNLESVRTSINWKIPLQ